MQAGQLKEHRRRFTLLRGALRSDESYEKTFFGGPENGKMPKGEYDRMKRENKEWIEG